MLMALLLLLAWICRERTSHLCYRRHHRETIEERDGEEWMGLVLIASSCRYLRYCQMLAVVAGDDETMLLRRP